MSSGPFSNISKVANVKFPGKTCGVPLPLLLLAKDLFLNFDNSLQKVCPGLFSIPR